MDLYPKNTMASFTNYFPQSLELDETWRVALCQISFPSAIHNLEKTHIGVSYLGDLYDGTRHEPGTIIRIGYNHTFPGGFYPSLEDIINEINNDADGPVIESHEVLADGRLKLKLRTFGGMHFHGSRQIPSIMGFDTDDGFIGIDSDRGEQWTVHDSNGRKTTTIIGDYAVDMTHGCSYIFIYVDFIKHQVVGDTNAPILNIIDTERRVKNGAVFTTTPIITKSFTGELYYKDLLKTYIQSVKVELRTETGLLVPFVGTGKTIITLKFRKFSQNE